MMKTYESTKDIYYAGSFLPKGTKMPLHVWGKVLVTESFLERNEIIECEEEELNDIEHIISSNSSLSNIQIVRIYKKQNGITIKNAKAVLDNYLETGKFVSNHVLCRRKMKSN